MPLFLSNVNRAHFFDRADAVLEQHVGGTTSRPYHEGRATVGPLKTRSLVARGFGQPLFVGSGIVQDAGWQQLVLLQGQLAEIGGSILGVHPVIHVVPGVRHLDHIEVVADRSVLFLIEILFLVGRVIVMPPSAAVCVYIEMRLGRTGLAGAGDSPLRSQSQCSDNAPVFTGIKSELDATESQETKGGPPPWRRRCTGEGSCAA